MFLMKAESPPEHSISQQKAKCNHSADNISQVGYLIQLWRFLWFKVLVLADMLMKAAGS